MKDCAKARNDKALEQLGDRRAVYEGRLHTLQHSTPLDTFSTVNGAAYLMEIAAFALRQSIAEADIARAMVEENTLLRELLEGQHE